MSCNSARSQLGRLLKTFTRWNFIGELHKISIFTDELGRILFIFDFFHLLIIDIFGDLLGFWGLGKGSKTVFGYTHIAEQLLCSIFPSILTFNFDLILDLFFTFWGPMGFFGFRVRFKNVF